MVVLPCHECDAASWKCFGADAWMALSGRGAGSGSLEEIKGEGGGDLGAGELDSRDSHVETERERDVGGLAVQK